MIVDTIKKDNGTAYIHDDCINHNPAEFQKAVEEIKTIRYNSLIRQITEKIEAEANSNIEK